MARLSLVLFVVSVILHTTWGYVFENPRTPRVIEDYPIRIQSAPYVAALFLDEDLWCGASIIDKQFVLTAAHCLQKANKNYTVLVGSDQYHTEGIFIDVEEILCHEHFDRATTANDICLLKLKETVPLGCLWDVEKILLPADERNTVGDAEAFGWGSRKSKDPESNVLHQAYVPVLDNDCCRIIYPDVTAKMICAGFKERNFCSGEAGSPLVQNNVLIGVASWDDHDCTSKPQVYTRVSSYVSWIETTISNNRH